MGDGGDKRKKLKVTGMHCAACAVNVEKALKSLDGVREADVDIATEDARVFFDSEKVSMADIEKAVAESGYGIAKATARINIGGMHCAACVKTVTSALENTEGVISADTISILEREGIEFRCISNSTRRSRKALSERLDSMGIKIPIEYIFTPAVAACRILQDKNLKRPFLLVTENVKTDFENNGFHHNEINADTVIIGDAGDGFTYDSLNRAFRQLLGGAAGIALEKDRYWRDYDRLSLSAGPFVLGLEYASGSECILAGKPSHEFFTAALQSMSLAPGDVIMIGDDISTDVGGAQNSGINGVLVRTGKYSAETLDKAKIVPDYIIESIADLPRLLGEINSR